MITKKGTIELIAKTVFIGMYVHKKMDGNQNACYNQGIYLVGTDKYYPGFYNFLNGGNLFIFLSFRENAVKDLKYPSCI